MNQSDKLWQKGIMPINSKIEAVVQSLEENLTKIVLVINDSGALEGTICDGDIRRGLLRGLNMSSPIKSIIQYDALVVSPEVKREEVMQLMEINMIKQVPIVDENRQIIGLHLWADISIPPVRSNLMVIMAGGFGKRLLPRTENLPKPMLLIDNKPMLEHIIVRAKREGFTHFVIAIHYLGYMVEEYFRNGENLGVKIDYLREDSPLGTAGALSLLDQPNEAFVVTNGDVISDIRYGEMIDFHNQYSAIATMAVREFEWKHPFGVVKTNGMDIVGFEEKPIARSHINAGVYVLSPKALSELTKNEHCDMPTLLERVKLKEMRTIAYPIHEPWLDVGRPDDLVKANKNNQI
jgi:dTDP-glucose pyrophosphorylase